MFNVEKNKLLIAGAAFLAFGLCVNPMVETRGLIVILSIFAALVCVFAQFVIDYSTHKVKHDVPVVEAETEDGDDEHIEIPSKQDKESQS